MSWPVGESLAADWKAPPRPAREPLKGRYVVLEPIEPKHYDSLWVNVSSGIKEMWTYLPYGPFASQAEMQQSLEKTSSGNIVLFAICNGEGGEALGWISWMRIEEAQACIEVGHLCFAPKLQRTKAATEAVYLLINQAFALGYRRVEWKCDHLNAPSVAAAIRYGFLSEGIFRQAVVYKGRNRDTHWFAIIDKEWPTLQKCYAQWLDPNNFDVQGNQRACLRELTAGARRILTVEETKNLYCPLPSCFDSPCKRHSKVQFVLTGFGPFAGVTSNPTTELMKLLPGYLLRNSESRVNLKSCTVLETSAVGSLSQLHDLVRHSEASDVFVHFGVDCGSDSFKLEQCAYNEATFRVPDERGFIPQQQKIIAAGGSISNNNNNNNSLQTSIDVEQLQRRLHAKICDVGENGEQQQQQQQQTLPRVNVSDDPGRFVCNWVYFNSLHLQLHTGRPVLFVHVPSFEICGCDEQLAFVRTLLIELSELFSS